MSLDKLSKQLSTNTTKVKSSPPIELWDPPYCGEIDLVIKSDGSWFYNGTIFKRMSLVKLFASVLKKEQDDYFLVTPVEKVKIRVEDSPFLITEWQWQDDDQSIMQVKTNLDDEFILDRTHLMEAKKEGTLLVNVRRNLMAKVHRNVYYQWADLAQPKETINGTELVFFSAKHMFSLGILD